MNMRDPFSNDSNDVGQLMSILVVWNVALAKILL